MATKQDYERTARVLRQVRDLYGSSGPLDRVAHLLASSYHNDNARFNQSQYYAACGYADGAHPYDRADEHIDAWIAKITNHKTTSRG